MAASSPMCVNADAADVASKAGDAKDSLQCRTGVEKQQNFAYSLTALL